MTYSKTRLLAGATLAFAMMAASSAQAQTVSGAVNADNRYMVTVSQGSNNTIMHTAPVNYSWGSTDRFSFNINSPDIKQCHVNVIVWGDGRVAEGFAGTLTGNGGTVYSGNGFNGKDSGMNAGGVSGVPSLSDLNIMSPATSGGVTSTGLASGHQVWGNVANNYLGSDFGASSVPSNFSWIRPATLSPSDPRTKNYMVFSTPCANLIKPKPVAVHMPGEHYQCYSLEKGDRLEKEEITIRDQFGRSNAVLGTPRMLCNPSSKRHGDKEYRIENEKRHLVCYDYVSQQDTRSHNLRINNQFAPDEVVSTRRQMFCVPSSKEHIDRITDPKETRYERTRPARPAPRIQRR